MQIISRIFEWLLTTGVGRCTPEDALRQMLGKHCPICRNGLAGHRCGLVCSVLQPESGQLETAALRRRVLHGDAASLPFEGAMDRDVIQYLILGCPIMDEWALLEFLSSAELWSPDWIEVVDKLTVKRSVELRSAVHKWTEL
jgi:hypothetical protein